LGERALDSYKLEQGNGIPQSTKVLDRWSTRCFSGKAVLILERLNDGGKPSASLRNSGPGNRISAGFSTMTEDEGCDLEGMYIRAYLPKLLISSEV
jgi:hypothetical protein